MRRRFGGVCAFTATVALLGASVACTSASASETLPTILSASVTHPSVGADGARETLSARVASAERCVVREGAAPKDELIIGLPSTVPCSNGELTVSFEVPPNYGRKPLTLEIAVRAVAKGHAATMKVPVVASASPPGEQCFDFKARTFLNHCDLRYANLENVRISEALVNEVDLEGADLKGATIEQSQLERGELGRRRPRRLQHHRS